jgi:hypothetical protein
MRDHIGHQITEAVLESAKEMAFATALYGIASGLPTEDVARELAGAHGLPPADIETVAADALQDALRQGIEREDIDPSWFRFTTSEDDGSNIVHP